MKYMLEEAEINIFMKSLADALEISPSQLQRDSINWDVAIIGSMPAQGVDP